MIASTTAIVFEPGWRWIASVTTCRSSYQLPIRSFSTPSTICPRSPSVTGEPLRYATIMVRYAAASKSCPFACTVSDWWTP